MELTIDVHLAALAACAVVASKDPTRPYICGVHVRRDAKGTTYTGTDGMVLLMLRDTIGGDDAEVIVPASIIGKPPRAPEREKLTVADGVIDIRNGLWADLDETLTYPDAPRVVPGKASVKTREQAQIAPAVMAQINKIAEILNGKKDAGVPQILLSAGPENRCIAVLNTGVLEGFAVFMPLRRWRADAWSRPDWVGGGK